MKNLEAIPGRGQVTVKFTSRAPVDLELWDAARETPLFRRVFGAKVVFQPTLR